MAWTYVANAARLAEPVTFAGIPVPQFLEDVWTGTVAGAVSLDPVNAAGLWATSTSTVNVENSEGSFVYVFNISGSVLRNSLTGVGGDSAHPIHPMQTRLDEVDVPATWGAYFIPHEPTPDDIPGLRAEGINVEEYQSFCKQDLALFHAGGIGSSTSLAAGLGMYPGAATLPTWRTSVPALLDLVSGWKFEYISRYYFPTISGSGRPFSGVAPMFGYRPDESFYVAYRDPTVIKVPTDIAYRWLMFVKRVRVFVTGTAPSDYDGHTASSTDDVGGMLADNMSISDIVVFKSNNADFEHDDGGVRRVKGPYLVVDSLESVEDNQTFRTANRVPCAVFDGVGDEPDLYVYYVVESSVRGVTTGPNEDFSFDEVTADQLLNQQDKWAGGGERAYATNGRGIAVKKIAYADLMNEVLDSSADPLPQSGWDRSSAVTGELLGLVRVWIPQTDAISAAGWSVRLWDDYFRNADDAGDHTPVKVDPCALWTAEGGIRLFYACFERGDAFSDAEFVHPVYGWGIWHAAAIGGGVSLIQTGDPMSAYRPRAIYGKDFVVRPPALGVYWPDMLALSNYFAADPRRFVDPDVFLLPDGDVVMLAGCVRYLDTGSGFIDYAGNPLGRFLGNADDLKWPWSDAF